MNSSAKFTSSPATLCWIHSAAAELRLVQASELGLHALGFDISEFNTLITNTKLRRHDLSQLARQIEEITEKLMSFYDEFGLREFDHELSERLSSFNAEYFPSPEFKLRARRRQVNANEYGREKARRVRDHFSGLGRQI